MAERTRVIGKDSVLQLTSKIEWKLRINVDERNRDGILVALHLLLDVGKHGIWRVQRSQLVGLELQCESKGPESATKCHTCDS